MKIDTHVHLLASRNRKDPEESFLTEGSTLYREMSHPQARQGWQMATMENLFEEMDKNRIQKAIAFGFPWRSHDRCRWDNEYVAECILKSGGRLMGLAVFQPFSGRDAVLEVKHCMEDYGFIGIKIKAQWQGYSLMDRNLLAPILEIVVANRGIVLVHVEQSTKPAKGNGPREFIEFIKQFQNVKIIAAHFGAMVGMYYPYSPIRECFKNVLFDCALGTAADVALAYIAVGLEKRLVFGSDFPAMKPGQILDELKRRVPEKHLNRILGDNLTQWIGSLLP